MLASFPATRPEDIPQMGRDSFDKRVSDHLRDDSMQSHFTRAGRHLYESEFSLPNDPDGPDADVDWAL